MGMTSETKKVRALGLCSGGLDSILAALVLRRQGIAVEWVTFETPFFSADKARRAAEQTGVPLRVKNIFEPYLVMLKNPNCGYGQHMNPCMDCHALMFRLAAETMRQEGFDFLFSGEVLGQRPMSQTRSSLRYVEKHSGADGYILRPLSARRLPETRPEQEGLVDRGQLMELTGRSRKRQIQLAREWGVSEYPAPAGGCLLTDKGYSRRLKDLFEHGSEATENELHLLRYGRHFRLKDGTKVIVGRTQADNEKIQQYADPGRDTLMKVENCPGPLVLVPPGGGEGGRFMAASLCVGYSRAPRNEPVPVRVTSPEGCRAMSVMGVPPADVRSLMV